MFQHTAARRRLVLRLFFLVRIERFQHTAARRRLAPMLPPVFLNRECFNTQPPEGGWLPCDPQFFLTANVSTHSRPKAAGMKISSVPRPCLLKFQHTAARRRLDHQNQRRQHPDHRFNTQPPESGWNRPPPSLPAAGRFQHTAARRRLDSSLLFSFVDSMFQHTAARRRQEPSSICPK